MSDPLGLSKTTWPVPLSEALFLPDFNVNEDSVSLEYSLLEYLSKGAYGSVHKVLKRDTRQIYALKVMQKSRILDDDFVQQVKREVCCCYF